MRSMIRILSLFFITAFTIMLAACGGASSAPGGSSNGNGVLLGQLPNGSNVYISQSNFTTTRSGSTSGTLSISGGIAGESYTFNFSLSPTTSPAPTVSSIPNPCVITSGNSSSNSCQLTFNANGAPESTYTVTVLYKLNPAGDDTQLPGAITFVVSGGSSPTVESGILVIMPLSVESIESGSTTTATVSLSGSQNITSSNPVIVSIFSNESAIMSVSESSCSLYTASNQCIITLTGESVGTATFSATAVGYAESTSETLIINPLPEFSCRNDPATGNSCGCLVANDGSGLTWYTDASQTGTWTNWCTPASDTSSNCASVGSAIASFNNANSGAGHCGYTDWHLPASNGGGAVADIGGNWGVLGTDAEDDGQTGANFAPWLTTMRFVGVNNSGKYWSSVSFDSTATPAVDFSLGSVGLYLMTDTNYVMLVRP